MLNETLCLEISELSVNARIGVYEHEHNRQQALLISLKATYKNIPENDRIDSAIDYDKLSASVREQCDKKHYNLLETLAHDIALSIFDARTMHGIEVTIAKPYAAEVNRARSIICRYAVFG